MFKKNIACQLDFQPNAQSVIYRLRYMLGWQFILQLYITFIPLLSPRKVGITGLSILPLTF